MKAKEINYAQCAEHGQYLDNLAPFRFHAIKPLEGNYWSVEFKTSNDRTTIKYPLTQKKAEKLAAQLNEVRDAIR